MESYDEFEMILSNNEYRSIEELASENSLIIPDRSRVTVLKIKHGGEEFSLFGESIGRFSILHSIVECANKEVARQLKNAKKLETKQAKKDLAERQKLIATKEYHGGILSWSLKSNEKDSAPGWKNTGTHASSCSVVKFMCDLTDSVPYYCSCGLDESLKDHGTS